MTYRACEQERFRLALCQHNVVFASGPLSVWNAFCMSGTPTKLSG